MVIEILLDSPKLARYVALQIHNLDLGFEAVFGESPISSPLFQVELTGVRLVSLSLEVRQEGVVPRLVLSFEVLCDTARDHILCDKLQSPHHAFGDVSARSHFSLQVSQWLRSISVGVDRRPVEGPSFL